MKKNEKLRKREKGEQRATNLTNGEREREVNKDKGKFGKKRSLKG